MVALKLQLATVANASYALDNSFMVDLSFSIILASKSKTKATPNGEHTHQKYQ